LATEIPYGFCAGLEKFSANSGWLASGVVALAALPTPPELEQLVRQAQVGTPAANDAAMLLALLETGRWVAAQTLFFTRRLSQVELDVQRLNV
jgi:predicted lipid carrier protein YhbT